MSKIPWKIISLISDLSLTVSQTVYVDGFSWSDVTGNWSIGKPYKTLPTAFASITDASTSKRYQVTLYRWTYILDVTVPNYVTIVGDWGSEWIVINASITLSSLWTTFRNLTLVLIPTTTKILLDAATNNAAQLFCKDCIIVISSSTSWIKPKLIDSNNTVVTLIGNEIVYINTWTWANAWTHDVITIAGTGLLNTFSNQYFVTSGQSSGDFNFIKDSWTWDSRLSGLFPSQDMTMSNASYSWEATFYNITATSWMKEVRNGTINVTGAWSWTGNWVKVNSGWNSLVVNKSWVITNISWFTNNYSSNVATTDIVNENFNNSPNASIGAWDTNIVNIVNWELRVNTNIIDENFLLGTPTNNSLQSVFNIWFNAGWVSWSEITDNLDWSVTVSAWTWLIRIANTSQSALKSFDIAENTNVILVDWASNIVYVDYNAWSPIYTSTTTRADILDNENDKYEVCEIVREWTTLHISDLKHQARSQGQQRAYSLTPVARWDNAWLILGETWTRNITVTAGSIWRKYIKEAVSAINTSVADTFDSYYTTDSYTTWTKVTWDTQWNNTQYNDITTWLVALSPASKYSFQDFYLNWSWNLVRVYWSGQYNAVADARETPATTELPVRLQNNSILIWRIIFQWNDTIAQATLSAFDITFT